jgi:hypothetical protein
MAASKLRSVIKVTRQANGVTWQAAIWVPRDDDRVHVPGTVLADGFETRKLAEVFCKAYRKGLVKP